jgi:nitric oxide dioxygenase
VKDSLPKELSAEKLANVLRVAEVLAPRAEDVAKAFYRRILESHLELFEFFNTSNQRSGRQQQAFGAAIVALASNVSQLGKLGPAIDVIASKHCALQVQPHHYLTVHEVLVASTEEVLGPSLNEETVAAWSEAWLLFSRVLVEREEALYKEAKARNGGWRGFRKFLVARREKETKDVVVFTLKPVDAVGVYFEFTPGQYLSVKIDPDGDKLTAPRHYTIISPPGMPYLQIAVKKLPGGKVSTFLHDHATEGHVVLLSPPFGIFTPVPAALGERSTAVLLSAGIGITPMFAFAQALGSRVVLAAHVDKSEENHPFRSRFQESTTLVQFHYTTKSGRPPKDLAAKLSALVGTDHDWYICGPGAFMCDAMRTLAESGVDAARIHYEAFGPQLCPAL